MRTVMSLTGEVVHCSIRYATKTNKQILSPAKALAATSTRCAAFRAKFGR
jgi:hypothetical protein